MTAFMIVLLALASMAGTVLIVLALSAGQKARKAQEHMAKENGWTFAYRPASGGSGAKTMITSALEGWSLTIYVHSSGGSDSSGTVTRWTRFEHPDPAFNDGLTVLGPEIPAKTAEMADKMLGKMGSGLSQGLGGMIGSMLLKQIMGDFADQAKEMRSVSGDGPGTLFATPGAETGLDAVRHDPALAQARQGKNQATQPVILRGDFGLHIRQSGALKKPEDIKTFIALGRDLAAKLSA